MQFSMANIDALVLASWQIPPDDIMDNVLQRLNISDRIRLSVVCKSWRSIVMRRDIQCGPQVPWLVFPQFSSKILRFMRHDEGYVEIKLPEGGSGWFHSSSKGWMVMINEQGLDSEVFLLNPISRAQHQLPSLSKVPSFDNHIKASLGKPNKDAVGNFLGRVVLSSANISECIVAAVFNPYKEFGLCRPGGKSWSIFQVIDDARNVCYLDVLLSGGMLYALVGHNTIWNRTVARTLNFGDDPLELKLLVYYKQPEWNTEVIENATVLQRNCVSYWLESTDKDQVLLIAQSWNFLRSYHAGYYRVYSRTCSFAVYQFDPESDRFVRIQTLGDQTVLVSQNSHCCSIRSSDFKGQTGNCIYFETPLITNQTEPRETGWFYLDGGKFIRGTAPKVPGVCWFSPSFC